MPLETAVLIALDLSAFLYRSNRNPFLGQKDYSAFDMLVHSSDTVQGS